MLRGEGPGRMARLTRRCVFVMALALSAACCGGSEPSGGGADAARGRAGRSVDPLGGGVGLPGRYYTELTADGAWNWDTDPRAVYYRGQHERTYIGWVTGIGAVRVSSFDHETGESPAVTVKTRLGRDDHANPALLVRPDGRLMIFYSAHCGPRMFYRITVEPEDICSWGEEMAIGTNTQGVHGYTYPHPVQLSGEGGRIYLFWRGGNFQPVFSVSDDGIVWSLARTLIRGDGERPYVKYESDGIETIHFAFNDGHPRREPENNLYYACYRGGTFYRADGSPIRGIESLPLVPSEADIVYDAAQAGSRSWVWDIALDRSGNPVIVYATFPTPEDHRYRYARWDGTRWEDHEITQAGPSFPRRPEGRIGREEHYYSGGVTLDHGDSGVVYLSREVAGVFEVEEWTTRDGGKMWTRVPVTSGSSKGNVRPYVPVGRGTAAREIIWMYGDYIDYQRYETGLRMRLAR